MHSRRRGRVELFLADTKPTDLPSVTHVAAAWPWRRVAHEAHAARRVHRPALPRLVRLASAAHERGGASSSQGASGLLCTPQYEAAIAAALGSPSGARSDVGKHAQHGEGELVLTHAPACGALLRTAR